MIITEKYTFFWKDKIGQWNLTDFKDNQNIIYSSAEQYMMAKKALLFNDEEIYQNIMSEKSPKIIQELGRKIKNFDQKTWDAHAQIIVYQGNYFKFTQNKELYGLLKSTGETILVEASPFDLIWGVGLSVEDEKIFDDLNWRGKNLLGYLLTFLRDNI